MRLSMEACQKYVCSVTEQGTLKIGEFIGPVFTLLLSSCAKCLWTQREKHRPDSEANDKLTKWL